MTTPARPQQAQQIPPPPPPSGLGAAAEAALVTTVAGLLVTATGAAAAMAAIVANVKLRLDLQAALYGSLTIAMQSPPPVTGVIGQASAQTSRQNLLRRAQFVVSAGKRLASDMAGARAQGVSVPHALAGGLARERRYYSQHTEAMWNRAVAAGKTDMAALEHGDLLGWATVLDSRTSPECKAADGKNYYASAMPDIGFPGSVHPHCRCYPTSPYPDAPLLRSSGKLGRANSPHMRMAAAS